MGSSPLRRIPAPYRESITPLLKHLKHGNHELQTVFYRTGDAGFAKPPKDIFAIGSFKEHHFRWSSDCSVHFDWEGSTKRLVDLSRTGLALAGYLSYESGFAHESRWHRLRRPADGYAWRFLEIDCWYEADHHTRSGTIYANVTSSSDTIEHLQGLLLSKLDTISHLKGYEDEHTIESVSQYGELSKKQYTDQVAEVIEDIRAGRYYELNFTQRFVFNTERNPTTAFIQLFDKHAPRRGFYCDFSDEVIGSCSPELYLKKEDQHIYTRPIKGSFNSAITEEERQKLDAEHIMVVDLARNDLGRISDLAWVQVPELASVSTFGGLNHIESLVAGESSLHWSKFIPRTFPAASITGVPKVEVVTAIADYEASPRGLYTGACGWIYPNGDIDLNVAIRTFVAQAQSSGWQYTIGAGGAIVADSDPEREYYEGLQKVKPLAAEVLGMNKPT